MNRLIPLFCLLALLSSCQFVQNFLTELQDADFSLEAPAGLGRGHLVSTLWIDKEYGFVYSIRIKGTNDLGQKVDVKSFEVTSFTDKPTAKDIPNPTQTSGGTAALKKQLQDQLNAMKK